ncbi:carboxypeptidase S [Multifurca ochricompacta]|uniref:Carboxypeptidase S n=1 Tax=Multifurca ochricompacta TaxID=376703 RepID=A0AAD4M306_9AGAM|nr:carboxypeptidase S [Multifurca ochricompacta]
MDKPENANAMPPRLVASSPKVERGNDKKLDSCEQPQGGRLDTFRLWTYTSLGDAVQIPTVSFDDMGPPGEDSRWESRRMLHDYLKHRFPRAHTTLTRTTVNHFGLAFHWQGSDPSVRPILLTAHQDVTPVDPESEHDWIYPPFSGHYDGDRIWGRGSGDNKSGVIGILTAIETVIEAGFQPSRTIVIAFGMDEERGGKDGGPAMSDYLRNTYGTDGFAMLVDEGYGFQQRGGILFSTPAVAEKGAYNVRIDVSAPGGHPMIPPRHTSIGILSSIIHTLESRPSPVQLNRDSPAFASLLCRAAYDETLPSHLRPLISRAQRHDTALRSLIQALLDLDSGYWSAVLGTTQAADLIGGGMTVNTLPQAAWAILDHRIADWSSISQLQFHYRSLLQPLLSSHNLTLDAFGDGDLSQKYDVHLSNAYGVLLEPSPVSPTMGRKAWGLLSGVIKDSLAHTQKSVVVSPVLALGNTDTRHYWALTRYIFRYSHINEADFQGGHGVNESIRGEAFIEMIRFYGHLILGADESDLEE